DTRDEDKNRLLVPDGFYYILTPFMMASKVEKTHALQQCFSTESLISSLGLGILCLVADRLLRFSIIEQNDWLRALSDNIVHGVIGMWSWAVVIGIKKKADFGEILLAGFLASVIDIDHFFLARSLSLKEFKNFFACMMNDILEIYDLPKLYLACTLLAFTLIIHTAFKYWLTNKKKDESLLVLMHKKILSLESANQDLQNRLLNLESANLMQELQSINNKCIAKIGFVDNKYEYLMDRTLTLQSEVVTTQTLCKEERLSLIDKIRSLESCVSEEHNRWYDSMKNLESQAREEVHSLEQTLCARLQALEETLCKHDKEPNKQKGSISNLLGIMGIPKDGLQNLANTLEGDKDLNSPRELSAEAEKELAIVEKTIREAHVDRVNPELKCILVILPSRHSPTGILMQREDVILQWIFLPRKPDKKLKTYIEKISDLIHK
ncbi:hypothetical protein STEG23_031180, partial [Scotinomys teguina]